MSSSIDDLPRPILVDILSRLSDSTELASCRLASKTLRSVSRDVRSITIFCSLDRYLRSRSPESQTLITPFKALVVNCIDFLSETLESLSIAVDRPLHDGDGDEYDEADDLFLTSVDFVAQWLPKVDRRLRSLSISDFWIQSCWRRSELLGLLSTFCTELSNLELKNAWLSVEGLKPMPALMSLTLEFIRLDDEDLGKVNECLPSLQILNLFGVGGLKDPKIRFLHLRTCQWTVTNAPHSLMLDAPNLIKLRLRCGSPDFLYLNAPLLSDFDLSVEKTIDYIEMHTFLSLKSFRMESSDLHSIIRAFPDGRPVEKLILEVPKWDDSWFMEMVDFSSLMVRFPNVKSVVLGPLACFELAKSFELEDPNSVFGWNRLKKLRVYFLVSEINVANAFISFILSRSATVSDVAVLIHSDVADHIRNCIISKCTSDFPRIRWKLGVWENGMEECWLSNGT